MKYPEGDQTDCGSVVPVLAKLMRLENLKIILKGALSRATVGIRCRALIVNLLSSPKDKLENLLATWPTICHGIDKIRGDRQDCAGLFDK